MPPAPVVVARNLSVVVGRNSPDEEGLNCFNATLVYARFTGYTLYHASIHISSRNAQLVCAELLDHQTHLTALQYVVAQLKTHTSDSNQTVPCLPVFRKLHTGYEITQQGNHQAH